MSDDLLGRVNSGFPDLPEFMKRERSESTMKNEDVATVSEDEGETRPARIAPKVNGKAPGAVRTAPNKPKAKVKAEAPPKVKAKAKVKAKPEPKTKAKVKAAPVKKAKGKVTARRNRDPAKLDAFGLRKESIKSRAAAIYAGKRGATLNEVKDKVGSIQFNLITELEERGFKVNRKEEPGKGGRNATRYFLVAAK